MQGKAKRTLASAGEVAGLATLGLVAGALWSWGERSQRGAQRTPPSAEPQSTQYIRALEPGRGRSAETPLEITPAGWGDILSRTYNGVMDDRVLAIAAGVTFYGLLALFPAVTALVSSYGLFASPAAIADHLAMLAGALPPGAFRVIQDQVARVLAKGDAQLSWTLAVSMTIALWGANSGMKAMIDALNVVYDEEEKRSFVRLTLASLCMTLCAMVAVVVAIIAVVVAPVIVSAIPFSSAIENLMQFARWPLLALGMMLALAVLYRFGPSRRRAKWRWITPGAVLASLVWLAMSSALSLYFSSFANYDAEYGSLAGVMALLIWMWLSAVIMLAGAELNSEMEHQTARDTTEGLAKPLGARGAVMADTVGSSSR